MLGTGCLGLSLRTTAIAAGVIALVESATWLALAIVAYMAYNCTFSVPVDLPMGLRLAYVVYFLNTKCHSDVGRLTPPGKPDLFVDGAVATAERTSFWSLGYICLSVLWLGATLLLLATIVGRVPGRVGAKLCYPWLIVVAGTMTIDLVAMGFYAIDASDFSDVNKVAMVSGVTIPDSWLEGTDPELVLKTGPLIIVAVTARGVIIWLLNGVLLVHVSRAVRAMLHEKADNGETANKSRGTARSPDERPGAGRPEPGPPPPLGPGAVPVLPALPVPAARLQRMPSRPTPSPPPPASRRVLTGRLSERRLERRDSDLSRQAATKDEIVHRLERRSHQFRSSGRQQPEQPAVPTAPAPSAAIEAKISTLLQSQTSPPPARGSPGDCRAEREQLELDDIFFPEDGHYSHASWVQTETSRHPCPEDYPRRRWEFEVAAVPQAAPRRPPRQVERSQSDRHAVAGEWRIGQRPPANLHGLSPRRSFRQADPAAATEELKRELPWSYLKANDQDLPQADLRRPHSPTPRVVVQTMYLPPSVRDNDFYRDFPTESQRKDDWSSRDTGMLY